MPTIRSRALLFGVSVCAGVLFSSAPAQAAVGFGIEPVVGYERTQSLIPTAHSRDGLLYGARLTLGVLLLSLEAEYLRGTDNETFPANDLTIKDTSDKAKVGLRSTFSLGGILSAFLRGGGQASRLKHEELTSGSDTVTNTPITYHPYFGVGLGARLGHSFMLTADVTTVFHNFPSMNDNEYQATAGLTVHFP